jgi:hypothetical protein
MPAVKIARLKSEVAGLGDLFSQTEEFKRTLDHMLDFYSDRVYRAGHNVPPPPLIPIYHIHPLVMQQIELELQRKCQEDETAGLALADVLWTDRHFETRQLAVFLLGQVSLDPPQPVFQRFQEWARPDEPAEILELLFNRGSARLRKEQSGMWLETIQKWLDNSSPTLQNMGLQALQAVVSDRQFNNLPPAYRMISKFLHSPHPSLVRSLQDLLEALARRSPTETVYFIRQILGSPTPPVTIRMIRKILPLLPPESQASLRQMLITRS